MSGDPVQTAWEGKYLRVQKRGTWEYVSRARDIRAVVVLAEFEDKVILIEQERVPIGRRCIELPAGLIGDHDPNADVEDTAINELQEEAGFTATSIERLGDFYSSPGMVAEGFTLVRAHGVTRTGAGGGVDGEDIAVHLVPRDAIPDFVAAKRAEGVGIDVKLLLLLAPFLAPISG